MGVLAFLSDRVNNCVWHLVAEASNARWIPIAKLRLYYVRTMRVREFTSFGCTAHAMEMPRGWFASGIRSFYHGAFASAAFAWVCIGVCVAWKCLPSFFPTFLSIWNECNGHSYCSVHWSGFTRAHRSPIDIWESLEFQVFSSLSRFYMLARHICAMGFLVIRELPFYA